MLVMHPGHTAFQRLPERRDASGPPVSKAGLPGKTIGSTRVQI